VLGAWGVKGWIKVQSFAADSKALLSTPRWLVRPPEGGGGVPQGVAGKQFPTQFRISEAREHGGVIVAHVDGVLDRTQAGALRGATRSLCLACHARAVSVIARWAAIRSSTARRR